jgi:hypothetical protein
MAEKPTDSFTPLSTDARLHQLKRANIFEFVDAKAKGDRGKEIVLPTGRLMVVIAPWGPRNAAGPVGPWMFACRDESGRIHHFALSPLLSVRVLHRGDGS